jgi:hypothetical protein
MSNNFFLVILIFLISIISFILGVFAYRNSKFNSLLRILKSFFYKSKELIQKNTTPENNFNDPGFDWKNYYYAYQFEEIKQYFENKINKKKLESEINTHIYKKTYKTEYFKRKYKALINELSLESDPSSYDFTIISEKVELDNEKFKILRIKLKCNSSLLTIELLCGIPKNRSTISGVLALHGYTSSPDKLMGLGVEDYSNSFGKKLLERGHVVVSPFLLNNGDLVSNISALGSLTGQNIMTLEIQKVFISINYLLGVSNIDLKKIGIYGISGGANLALHVAALDKRIKCVVASGIFRNQLNTFIDYSMGRGIYKRNSNYFRSNYYFIPPNYYIDFSYIELSKLIYPTPLLFENGKKDIYLNEYQDLEEYKKVEQFYRFNNHEDKIFFDNHEGAHEAMGNKSYDWLDRWLKT